MKIVTIVGARPQFIKAATVSRVITNHKQIHEVLIHTGQHYDNNMSDVFFKELNIHKPDYNLGIGGGTHGQNTGRMIECIEQIIISEKPNWVLVYGDTDSTLAGALSAVKLNFPVAHIEAGLRSFNRRMPEEINRVLTDHASDLLFAPTSTAVVNLKNEGIHVDKVRLVGDVMHDAALYYKNLAIKPQEIQIPDGHPFLLCTIHRAENTDEPERLLAILKLLNHLAEQIAVVLPMHPRTKAALTNLRNVGFDENVKIIEPVSYLKMIWLLANCKMVLTDSGGVQKEAFFHKKPCVTLRDETEWVELLDLGWNRLVPPLSPNALEMVLSMTVETDEWDKSLFGDGQSSQLIVDDLFNFL